MLPKADPMINEIEDYIEQNKDRFLTLISTDNGNSEADPDDWITFVEPALLLQSIQANPYTRPLKKSE